MEKAKKIETNANVFSGDLDDLNTTKYGDIGAEFELKHPVTRLPLGIFIGVYGQHSETFQTISKERQDKRTNAAAMAGRMGIDVAPLSADKILSDAIELMAACIYSWRTGDKPTLKFEGQEITFSAQNAIKVLTALVWVREQTDAAIGNVALFIKA